MLTFQRFIIGNRIIINRIINRRDSLMTQSRRMFLIKMLCIGLWCLMLTAHLIPARADADTKNASSVVTAASANLARTAERNITTAQGSFHAQMRFAPPDPRAGETINIQVVLGEKIEGGFSNADHQSVNAQVVARVVTADGATFADTLTAINNVASARSGSYDFQYAFPRQGDYKIIFDFKIEDGRALTIDFPFAVIAAPVNWLFWFGLAVLGILSASLVFGFSRSSLSDDASEDAYKAASADDEQPARLSARGRTLPVALGALTFFGVGAAALAYLSPPRERRPVAALPPVTSADEAATLVNPLTGDAGLGNSGAVITIPKESQLLFGIRTAPVETRNIIGGLKTTGTVQARPEASAIVSPPVSGRVFFNRGIAIGAAVTRNQPIGYVEQFIGAPEQATLEAQRLQLRTAALEQQAQRAAQEALAQQARTRLAQANRELQRAQNLLAVGAAPRRRVEEARTAVQLATQEVTSAEHQARLAAQQSQLAQQSIGRVVPERKFALLAPVTGIIAQLNVATGQQAEAGAPLVRIVNLSTVYLNAQVFERDLPTVRDSLRASYTSPALNGETYRIGQGGDGRIVAIGQAVEATTRTVPVIFEVPNPLNRLRDGMFVEITFDTTGAQSVLSVPKQAVITEQGLTFVFVFDGGERFERRAVTLGAEGQDYYQITAGLQAGERVVVEGIYQLRSTPTG